MPQAHLGCMIRLGACLHRLEPRADYVACARKHAKRCEGPRTPCIVCALPNKPSILSQRPHALPVFGAPQAAIRQRAAGRRRRQRAAEPQPAGGSHGRVQAVQVGGCFFQRVHPDGESAGSITYVDLSWGRHPSSIHTQRAPVKAYLGPPALLKPFASRDLPSARRALPCVK
jgi:hypothetical protein